MTINISLPEQGRGQTNLRPLITIIGVGGAGGNAINNMISSNLEGVDFLVANTDAQALENSTCERRIQLGLNSTKGLGAGMRPNIGKDAAEEAAKDIEEKLEGINMAFIAAGMGGGTGTGASPVIAKIAREKGILTVGVVTKPFHFEGIQRMRLADQGIDELEQHVDTLLIIPNQNLFKIANERTTFSDAFKMADDVLYAGVRGVTDLMVMPGLINLDFSDVKTVMSEMGKSMMGIGQAEGSQGESRAIKAAEAAIANPLIDDVSLKGAKGLIINITGGKDLTLYEVDEAANRIREEVDVDANIIFGSTCDERLEGVMRVSIVATGIQGDSMTIQKPIEKPSINIDNSVYKQPVKSEGLSLYSSLQSKEKIETSDIKKPLELDNKIQANSNNNIATEELTSSEEKLSIEEDLSNLNNDHQEIKKAQVDSEIKNSEFKDDKLEENYSSNGQDIDKSSFSEQSLDEIHPSNDQNSQETHVRRLSLFDVDNSTIDKHQKNKIDSLEKKEPFLDTMETTINEAENNNEENEENNLNYEENSEENSVMDDIENEISQEEELLDVPTFLRRQAN